MRRHAVILAAVCAASPATGSDKEVTLTDPAGDTAVRRTDFGADGVINPAGAAADLLEVRLGGWAPLDPESDPYTGVLVEGGEADIFRLVLIFDGLMAPPGPLGLGGMGYDPFRFGESPVYGFLDLDVDEDKDTGGELDGAVQRYLANVARFQGLPEGSINERAVKGPGDCDTNFFTAPQFERSGADFAFVLCGCWDIEVVEVVSGDGNLLFEAGERWIVRGRFLERAQGYQEIAKSFSSVPPGEGGGTGFGLYDPLSNALWEHDAASDRTTITFVGALSMEGAAQLAGEAVQAWDFDTGNHTSVREGLEDLVFSAENCPGSGPAWELIERWDNKDAVDYLDPTDWGVAAIFGMPYAEKPLDGSGALYVWTDVGFDEVVGDYNGDSLVDSLDEAILQAACDAGPTQIPGFATCFSLLDTNYDGVIDADDCPEACLADANGDGTLNVLDFVAFQSLFSAGDSGADANGDGTLNVLDFVAFQSLFAAGCP